MKPNNRISPPLAILGLILVGLLAVTVFGQPVQAQRADSLKPPFQFVEQPQQRPNSVIPPGSTVILTETFGVSFAPTTTLTGNLPAWRIYADSADTAGYYWGRVGAGSPITFTDSAWSAAEPIGASPVLTAGVDSYPAGQDTWLIYGPIDASRFMYVHLSFESYRDVASGDLLGWGFSTDGQAFYGNEQAGAVTGWVTDTLSQPLNWMSGSTQYLYLGFRFKSGASPAGLGAFIRNVRLTAERAKLVYLPLVLLLPTPTPTPTSTPTLTPTPYGDTFDDNGASLDRWGGAFYGTDSSDGKKYGQCLPGECTIHTTYPHGNPGTSLRLYTNGLYKFKATSSNVILPDNYDLYVDISPWVIYPRDAGCVLYGCPSNDLGDWYGIIFNASTNTFGADMSDFAYNKKYYRVYFYNVDSVKPITIRLDRCDGSSDPADNSCHKLGSSSLPANFIGNAGGFDTVHIARLASGTIQVWVNGNLLITADDSTYTGSSYGKYGVFIFSWDNNAPQNPPAGYEMQVDFDNIKVYNH